MRIPYTIEMQRQDALHSTANEDRDIMQVLHHAIIKHAQTQGLTVQSSSYLHTGDDNEVLTAVFVDATHQTDVSHGNAEVETFGTCQGLILEITRLNHLLNVKQYTPVFTVDTKHNFYYFYNRSDAETFIKEAVSTLDVQFQYTLCYINNRDPNAFKVIDVLSNYPVKLEDYKNVR